MQSIGAGVRDAAAYVLWSLARTLRASQIAAHSEQLAVHLVAVSLFDREVQIRRAASAAFQESVGRWVRLAWVLLPIETILNYHCRVCFRMVSIL